MKNQEIEKFVNGTISIIEKAAEAKSDDDMKKVNTLSKKLLADIYTPEHIIHNWKTDETIVIWKGGMKTKVKLAEDEKPNPYVAFTAALAKRILGSNSRIKKIAAMTEEPLSTNPKRNEKRKEYLIEKCTPKKTKKKEESNGNTDRHKAKAKKEASHS